MTIKKFVAALLAGILIGLFVDIAYAQEKGSEKLPEAKYNIYVLDTPEGDTIALQGDFEEGISDTLKKVMEAYPHIKRMVFASPGGNAVEAYKVAWLINQREMHVYVPQGRICLSACAIAFMAGSSYQVEGVLGFHNAWRPFGESVSGKEAMEAFNLAQLFGTISAEYIVQNGFVFDFASQIAAKSSPAVFGVFLTTESFTQFLVKDRNNFSEYFEDRGDITFWDVQFMSIAVRSQMDLERANRTFKVNRLIKLYEQPLSDRIALE